MSDAAYADIDRERDGWLKKLAAEEKAHKDWRKEAKDATGAYLDDRSDNLKTLFPIFWSSIQITHAAIYARDPRPDVRKRYVEAGSGQNRLAQAVERALTYTQDTTDFGGHAHRAVDDFLIAGLGQAKIELETKTAQGPVLDPTTQQPIPGEDGQPILQTVVTYQCVKLRHFPWSRFHWEPGKDWEVCDWVGFDHYLTAAEIKAQFGKEVTYNDKAIPTGEATSDPKATASQKYATHYPVTEIWDKKKKRRLYVSDCHPEVLESEDDPLRLEGFFPCPKPMLANLRSDELVPKPDYCFISSQCDYINVLTKRIFELTRQIKDVGFYDAQLGELDKLMHAKDGELVPIANLAERLNAAGRATLDNVIARQDNAPKATVVKNLIELREQAKNVIFETLGLADIIRGASVASETASAQQIKAQWANVRIGSKVQTVALFFRGVFRIMAELIGEHFVPEQIMRMSAVELGPEELDALKSDLNRSYAIDVETDSTIAQEESEDRQQRLEMLKAITEYLTGLLPAVMNNTMPAELAKELLLFAVRSFKHGRQLEDTIAALPDSAQQLQQLQQQLQQAQQAQQQAEQQAAEAGQAAQQAQQQLAQADERNAGRDDARAQATIEKERAQAAKASAEAQVIPLKAQADLNRGFAQQFGQPLV